MLAFDVMTPAVPLLSSPEVHAPRSARPRACRVTDDGIVLLTGSASVGRRAGDVVADKVAVLLVGLGRGA